MIRELYINLPTKNVGKTRKFFSSLGFDFDEKFCSDNSLRMIIDEKTCVMFLNEERFKDFSGKEMEDVRRTAEVVFVLSVNSKEEVDGLIEKAINLGGREINKSKDYGAMYGRNFEDLDGHIWSVFFMGK